MSQMQPTGLSLIDLEVRLWLSEPQMPRPSSYLSRILDCRPTRSSRVSLDFEAFQPVSMTASLLKQNSTAHIQRITQDLFCPLDRASVGTYIFTCILTSRSTDFKSTADFLISPRCGTSALHIIAFCRRVNVPMRTRHLCTLRHKYLYIRDVFLRSGEGGWQTA
jgi:hypothetical protein